jgi:hypothetical protein
LPLFGASRRRIDFAVRHPDDPARFVLAVECDGPSYAAFATARDRDRLRRQHLESLGWRHHRIWSVDWFLRRDEEMERLLEALRGATGPVPAAPEGEKPSDTAGMPARTRRPAIPRRENIDDYNPRDIAALLDWIESDGRLRTDDEILDELTEVLGFRRRGARIEAVLTEAIRRRRPSR